MSKRLIYAEDAIEALGEKPLVWDDLSDFDLGKAAQWSDDVDAIKNLPSAQPQRMKGKWIPFDIPWYQCSECGAIRENKTFMENFCPNCGADMRGGQDG